MRIPVIKGIIERRILINYAIDPEIVKSILPAEFSPKTVNGKAIAGICLIRLGNIRPKGLPGFIGFGSENGAHRIAVEWDEKGEIKEGVYIPRRDTSSKFNTLVGGRLFPGKHYHADFDVNEGIDNYNVAFKSSDGTTISVKASLADKLNEKSVFKDLLAVSDFFRAGSAGYSPNGDKYEGLLLNAYKWELRPLKVSSVKSSFFENESVFPIGSVTFDNALLMTDIEHEWSSLPDKQNTTSK